MVVIPASVTDLTSAFEGCTSLTEVTLEHSHDDLINGNVTMTNCFKDCSSLETIYCHNAISEPKESTDWHAYRVVPRPTFDKAIVSVFDKNGEYVNSQQLSVNVSIDSQHGNLVSKVKTNLVSFGTQLGDYSEIHKMMISKCPFTNDDEALDPNKKNFILWGDVDPDTQKPHFTTNLELSGEVIDDSTTRQDRTWSSSKISEELGKVDHATTADSATVADHATTADHATFLNPNKAYSYYFSNGQSITVDLTNKKVAILTYLISGTSSVFSGYSVYFPITALTLNRNMQVNGTTIVRVTAISGNTYTITGRAYGCIFFI